MYSSLSSNDFPFILFWLNLRTQAGYAERSTPQQTVWWTEQNYIREPKKTHDTGSLNILTSGLLSPCWAAASSSRSKSHLTGGGKWGGTFRIVPKKSSTNFWIVPLVESSRVRKISGMDLWERAAKQETINNHTAFATVSKGMFGNICRKIFRKNLRKKTVFWTRIRIDIGRLDPDPDPHVGNSISGTQTWSTKKWKSLQIL